VHEVLNAKNHEREALIIQNAGERGAVTIATNMAGRGVDIKLADGVSDIGGLYVLGTERHESRRIDNQLRGRSGRQGDPGESRFYLSAQDEVIRLFAGERIYKILDSRFGPPDGEPIEAKMLTNKIEGAQKKVEEFHFVNRKNVVKYDDVMNEQRKQVYATRRGILEGGDLREILVDGSEEQPGWIEQVIEAAVAAHTEAEFAEDWDWDGMWVALHSLYPMRLESNAIDREKITLEELLEIWVSRTLAMHAKPVVVLDPDGVYDGLRTQVDLLVAREFVRPAARNAVVWVTDVAAAFDAIEAELAAGGAPTLTAAPDEVLEADT
jgi:preprotein translocase subunit SecA